MPSALVQSLFFLIKAGGGEARERGRLRVAATPAPSTFLPRMLPAAAKRRATFRHRQRSEEFFFFLQSISKGFILNLSIATVLILFNQKPEFGTRSHRDEKVARSLLDLRKCCSIIG